MNEDDQGRTFLVCFSQVSVSKIREGFWGMFARAGLRFSRKIPSKSLIA